MRVNKTIYVGGIHTSDDAEEVVARQLQEWARFSAPEFQVQAIEASHPSHTPPSSCTICEGSYGTSVLGSWRGVEYSMGYAGSQFDYKSSTREGDG